MFQPKPSLPERLADLGLSIDESRIIQWIIKSRVAWRTIDKAPDECKPTIEKLIDDEWLELWRLKKKSAIIIATIADESSPHDSGPLQGCRVTLTAVAAATIEYKLIGKPPIWKPVWKREGAARRMGRTRAEKDNGANIVYESDHHSDVTFDRWGWSTSTDYYDENDVWPNHLVGATLPWNGTTIEGIGPVKDVDVERKHPGDPSPTFCLFCNRIIHSKMYACLRCDQTYERTQREEAAIERKMIIERNKEIAKRESVRMAEIAQTNGVHKVPSRNGVHKKGGKNGKNEKGIQGDRGHGRINL